MKRQPGSLFVTVEGGEGAGKSTLLAGLRNSLEALGISILCTREPGGTELAEKIRKLLLSPESAPSPRAELLLFLAARAEHVEKLVLPALSEGKVVLCDRFHDSSIAYQGVARGLGAAKVEELCDFASRSLWPDLTLYLDLDPEEGMKRASSRAELDRMERERAGFRQLVRQGFLAIQERQPHRFHALDARLSPDQLLEQALAILRPLLPSLPSKGIS